MSETSIPDTYKGKDSDVAQDWAERGVVLFSFTKEEGTRYNTYKFHIRMLVVKDPAKTCPYWTDQFVKIHCGSLLDRFIETKFATVVSKKVEEYKGQQKGSEFTKALEDYSKSDYMEDLYDD
ncbi:uncharacterized protein FOMMEDRAFT_28794 [Fomitiporia mediterranea MF3/22]|uniref:uncharacterized protein n=1 Tax=Fomitiporia mediterranea (strain MF3/22) TaxID=694068 RepID=UPI00044080A2|nr:uncharacterized protein FOMMEDRAFT_28794 [Fomitiporia mediterranea MF3/22]EJD03258.1 hypothetical protein FOMMEDRAFT_28794 [Fomitiporia mediterranea MF3/22]